MEIHNRPIAERIEWLMTHSRSHSETFCSPEASLARERYLAEHTTQLIVLKCMDGRIHIPYATRTPLGIFRPLRNLGGMFNLGWPYLGEVLTHMVQEAVAAGRRSLIFITYHFSQGEESRGCAGFQCDMAAAIRHAYEIRAQVEETFGTLHQTVYPLVCGFETDEDALIIHGIGDAVLNLGTWDDANIARLPHHLQTLLPDMPASIRRDLLPLLIGNLEHIQEMRQTARTLDIEHREWIICIGRGFDFLHIPNIALIIGPYSPDLADPIQKAAGIISANMSKGRIPNDGFLLLASAPYQEMGVDRARATLKSRFLSQFAAKVIASDYPELARKMVVRTAVLNWNTRGLELIE
nr:carboxysome shell carbonic anhydrase domain-containg protein [Chrysiogenes arsenatis]